MKVQLNYYLVEDNIHVPVGAPQDVSSFKQNEMLARATQDLVSEDDSILWFYTVESSTDIWNPELIPTRTREFGSCLYCELDIAKWSDGVDWAHLDGSVGLDHPAYPKPPVVIPNNEMELLMMKYMRHLKEMGSDTYLEFHHHYNTTVEFTQEEWDKLQDLSVDAFEDFS